MATAQCIENVKKRKPPRVCTDPYCAGSQSDIDATCHSLGWGAGTPYQCKDPDLNGPGKPGFCFCCCSCFGFGTPIAAASGVFIPVEEIRTGQKILAAGKDLQWKERLVAESSSIAAPGVVIADFYRVQYGYPGEPEGRNVLVASDHLFLAADGSLIAAQDLRPGHLLSLADEGTTPVTSSLPGNNVTGIQTLDMGPFDGKNFDGHLLNSWGIVSADWAIQLAFQSNHLDASFLHEASKPDAPRAPRGELTAEEAAFLADPDSWPSGFTPHVHREIRPPAYAKALLTHRQAEDVRDRAPMSSPENTIQTLPLLYVFSVARSFFPKATLLLDWASDLPNAYTWEEWGSRMVVITGALVRVDTMQRDGLALILAAMLGWGGEGVSCVGEADYYGLSVVARMMWDSDLFFTVAPQGQQEVTDLFGYVTPEHAREGRDVCKRPSLACRLETFEAALTMSGVPACARPGPDTFDLLAARADTLDAVYVRYSDPVDPIRAETPANYRIQPAGVVTSAVVAPANESMVELTVEGLGPDERYLLTVKGVRSRTGVPINPKHDSVAFATPPAARQG
jgi:hypothetical protein